VAQLEPLQDEAVLAALQQLREALLQELIASIEVG
jgi:hypothetical protein